MKTVRLLITGRVQGVGFREWFEHHASRLRLTGWVRNVDTDTVEAIISGQENAVDACVSLCAEGPELASVLRVRVEEAPPPEEPIFVRRASVTSLR